MGRSPQSAVAMNLKFDDGFLSVNIGVDRFGDQVDDLMGRCEQMGSARMVICGEQVQEVGLNDDPKFEELG